MSREQLTEHESDQDLAAARPEEQQGRPILPPELHAQIMSLRPTNSAGLADLLAAHFSLTYQILAVASPHMGNSAVQRALDILNKRDSADQRTVHANEVASFLEDSSDPAKPTQSAPPVHAEPAPVAQVRQAPTSQPAAPELDGAQQKQAEWDELDTSDTEELQRETMQQILAIQPGDAAALARLLKAYPSVEGKIRTVASRHLGNDVVSKALGLREEMKTESGWSAGARKYNEHHVALAQEFNSLTDYQYEDDNTGMVDPTGVASWQRAHGLEPDGKVGPKTLAAAREKKTTGSMIADGPQAADEGIPV